MIDSCGPESFGQLKNSLVDGRVRQSSIQLSPKATAAIPRGNHSADAADLTVLNSGDGEGGGNYVVSVSLPVGLKNKNKIKNPKNEEICGFFGSNDREST